MDDESGFFQKNEPGEVIGKKSEHKAKRNLLIK
jgi:hypothetical protein